MDDALAILGRLLHQPQVKLSLVSASREDSNLAEWSLRLASEERPDLDVQIELGLRTWPSVRPKGDVEQAILRVAGLLMTAAGAEVAMPHGHRHSLGDMEPAPLANPDPTC